MAQNPFKQSNVTVTSSAVGLFTVTLGSNTYTVLGSGVADIFTDRREDVLLTYLLCQFALVLQQAGVNPLTAPLATIISTIEAQQYWN